MLKRMSLVIACIAALMVTTTAFAQAPTTAPVPATVTRINMLPGTSAYTFTTDLTQGAAQGYLLGVSAGQSIYIVKTGNASVELLDPQGNLIAGANEQPGPWGVSAAQTGDYTLILNGQDTVTVSIYIPPLYGGQQFSTIAPAYLQRISFAPGSTNYSLQANFAQGIPAGYVLGIAAGQQLNVTTQGNLTVAVLDPEGNALPASSVQYGQWQYTVPQTGDYMLIGLGTDLEPVSIYIPPLGTSLPPTAPTRIRFLPGAISSTVTAYMAKGYAAPQYVLGIAAGQTLYVGTTGTVSSVQVFDPLGNLVAGYATPNGSLAFNIAQTGDYQAVLYGSGPVSITFYIPPL